MSYLGKRKYDGPYKKRTFTLSTKQNAFTRSSDIAAAMRARAVRASRPTYGPYTPSYGGYRNQSIPQMSSEKKVIDSNSNIYVFATSPPSTLLNGCIAGSQNYNRIGRKIFMKSLQVRGYIHAATDGTATEGLFRMIIVYDKQSNGAAPAYTDVIRSQNVSGVNSSSAADMINLDNRDRFIILRDRAFAMSQQSTVATQAVAGSNTDLFVDEYLRINMETIYNAGTAGTVGDITTGGFL